MKKEIRIIIENQTNSNESEMNATNLDEMVKKIRASSISLNVKTLNDEIKETYKIITESISQLNDVNSKIELTEVEFSLGFDSNGKISLLSVASGSQGSQIGIKFKLKIKNETL